MFAIKVPVLNETAINVALFANYILLHAYSRPSCASTNKNL